MLVGAAGLVLGCCLGGGIVAAGVAVFGDGHRGDDRIKIDRNDRGDNGFRPGGREGNGRGVRPGQNPGQNPGQGPGQGGNRRPGPPAASTAPAPTTAVPAPSAS
ncbi:hypothetical protein GCM10009827_053040 [Dactylosporangium maewongense]|uniref:Translation initiation factor IF-2 n=1 Tax=Dactylosporangium maewongense TaxID=634393 RepID=A0ABN2AWM5_9ACTN